MDRLTHSTLVLFQTIGMIKSMGIDDLACMRYDKSNSKGIDYSRVSSTIEFIKSINPEDELISNAASQAMQFIQVIISGADLTDNEEMILSGNLDILIKALDGRVQNYLTEKMFPQTICDTTSIRKHIEETADVSNILIYRLNSGLYKKLGLAIKAMEKHYQVLKTMLCDISKVTAEVELHRIGHMSIANLHSRLSNRYDEYREITSTYIAEPLDIKIDVEAYVITEAYELESVLSRLDQVTKMVLDLYDTIEYRKFLDIYNVTLSQEDSLTTGPDEQLPEIYLYRTKQKVIYMKGLLDITGDLLAVYNNSISECLENINTKIEASTPVEYTDYEE